jgi:hypothetical protein
MLWKHTSRRRIEHDRAISGRERRTRAVVRSETARLRREKEPGGCGGPVEAWTQTDRRSPPHSESKRAGERMEKIESQKGAHISTACTSALFTTGQSHAVLSLSPDRQHCGSHAAGRFSTLHGHLVLQPYSTSGWGNPHSGAPMRCAAMRCDAVGGFPFSKGKSRLLQLPDVACLPVQLLRLVAITGAHRPLLSHPTANKARCLDRRICLSRVTASSLSTMDVFLKNIISKGGSCLQVDGKPPNDG